MGKQATRQCSDTDKYPRGACGTHQSSIISKNVGPELIIQSSHAPLGYFVWSDCLCEFL
ncbi:MAG: hypothetical protein UY29_C0001G0020 [Parcubacteria group bacterium GW2011_GWC2_48_17]|nr:MAG: hypothetical protein UY29_C0001G0020 [Parcubacteria group bacterium GW2011_GWC2_48_17]